MAFWREFMKNYWQLFLSIKDKPFKGIVLDPDTLQEKFSKNFRPLDLLLALLSLFFAGFVLSLLLLLFSPLGRWISPDSEFAAHSNKQEIQSLKRQVTELEQQMKSDQIYLENLKNIIVPEGKNKAHHPNVSSSFVVPTNGMLTREFETNDKHKALDFAAQSGTPIVSIQKGKVEKATFDPLFGNLIEISHPDRFLSKYMHCQSILVKQGDSVSTGQNIATVGSTGSLSSGPHLHFELFLHGKSVDPRTYLNLP
ncbi:MAG: hypothetical protein C4K58_01115 [Flavobacteriaceae bacterium]|nr:MAG: hypothetical protein C4K58_01115 [Flavobacteriaceae bacterium]